MLLGSIAMEVATSNKARFSKPGLFYFLGGGSTITALLLTLIG